MTPDLVQTINGDILTQTRKYMSFITIEDIQINQNELKTNTLNVGIRYIINDLGSTDKLFLTLSN